MSLRLWLLRRAQNIIDARPADLEISGDDAGDVYLQRWFILPRNPVFNLYLHRFLKDDDDRALHDHPWWSLSVLLDGALREVTHDTDRSIGPGAIVVRKATFAHRLKVVGMQKGGRKIWPITAFMTGPRIRQWGFHCPHGWVHWRDFTGEDGTKTGRGCENE
jgi:hypothetical protein